MAIPVTGGKRFGFDTASDFLDKLEWEYEQVMRAGFATGRELSYHFMNFAITGWHMADWTYPHLPSEFKAQFKQASDFAHWVKTQSFFIEACRDIANASKHFDLKGKSNDRIETIAMPGWNEIHDNTPSRMSLAIFIEGNIYELDAFAQAVVSFWQCLLQTQGLLRE